MPAVKCPACGTVNGVDQVGKSGSCWKCKTELFPHLGQPATKQPKEVSPYSPESGVEDTKPREELNDSPKKKRKGFAITSLVLGIIGGYPWASTASIFAIIFGHVALNKLKKNPDIYSGKGLATAGLILGYLGLAIAIMLGVMRGILKAELGL